MRKLKGDSSMKRIMTDWIVEFYDYDNRFNEVELSTEDEEELTLVNLILSRKDELRIKKVISIWENGEHTVED